MGVECGGELDHFPTEMYLYHLILYFFSPSYREFFLHDQEQYQKIIFRIERSSRADQTEGSSWVRLDQIGDIHFRVCLHHQPLGLRFFYLYPDIKSIATWQGFVHGDGKRTKCLLGRACIPGPC